METLEVTSKTAIDLSKYGNKVIKRNVEIDADSTVFTQTSSRILTKNSIAVKPTNYRAVQYSDKSYILSLPMAENETGKIYEIIDPEAYLDWKIGGEQRRLYPINKMKLVKEIKQHVVNKKLYGMSFSGYKK